MEISMKSILTVIVLCAAAICAPAQTNKKENAAPAPKVVAIPKDAVQNPDGTYSYTDKDGKKWIYIKTPFGVMKNAAPDTPASTDPPPDSSLTKPGDGSAKAVDGLTKAIDKGDTVRFERASPFGPMSWEKKKSELTDDERRILDAQTAKTEQK
jgi:hypothetical protein